jgi:hypothetical protein
MSKVKLSKRLLWKYHDFVDYFFRTEDGRVVFAEVPNANLIIFMISLILGVVLYPGLLQRTAWIVAFISVIIWSYREMRGGVNRFRRWLGGGVFIMVFVTLLLYFVFK